MFKNGCFNPPVTFRVNLTPFNVGVICGQFDPRLFFTVKHIGNINFFMYLKGYLGSQQTNIKYLTLKLGKQY